jgi:uncharacterized damage-inducible protein DinB
MTYYGTKELAESFRTVRNNTIQVAEEIPENKYSFSVADGTRNVEKMLTHIALSHRFQEQFIAEKRTSFEGLNFPELFAKFQADEAKPRTKAEIIKLLKENGESWAKLVEGLSEATLAEKVTMPPGSPQPTKSRFEMILSVKEHEMHHRGQLMLIERMLHIVPHLTRNMQARMAQQQETANKR